MHKRIKFWPSSEWLILVKWTAWWATAREYAWNPVKTPHMDGNGFLWPLYRKAPRPHSALYALYANPSLVWVGKGPLALNRLELC